MEEVIITKIPEIRATHKKEHEGYEYHKRELVPARQNGRCKISCYEIPPQHAAYPYHYHTGNEEAFYIIQGIGLLKTPSGEKNVSAGDFMFFPAGEKGGHKLTNISDTETLTCLDFGTHNEIDVAFYPDSGKVGIWGKGIDQLYKIHDQVSYYNGE